MSGTLAIHGDTAKVAYVGNIASCSRGKIAKQSECFCFLKAINYLYKAFFCASFYLLAGRNCAGYIRGARFSACMTNAPLLWKSSAKNSKVKVTIKIKQHKPNEM